MLTGRPPFAGSSPAAVQYQKAGTDPPPPARLRLDRPPRPSFGVWLGYLRAALELPRGASPFVDRLREAAYAPRPGGGNWLDLAGEVVAARNDARHGRAAPDDGRHFGELLARVHDLLRDLAWL